MTADGPRAKATLRLALAEDRTRPKYGSYQLIFKNAAGQQNPQPVRHEIEVTRDIAPEIEFVAPNKMTSSCRPTAFCRWKSWPTTRTSRWRG